MVMFTPDYFLLKFKKKYFTKYHNGFNRIRNGISLVVTATKKFNFLQTILHKTNSTKKHLKHPIFFQKKQYKCIKKTPIHVYVNYQLKGVMCKG
jgi:hypothetical protein